ncbi:hypothetical protein [Saccharothrix texasensis]|uniref:ATP/GTP-binding protein n=1 Tax=Saccharothrix texasensis TaxID=103734 RepID=A0A3N1H457_9PSEU|nr:hypothetical protein [Saccharothrix texasensis]ROP37300.1 hypothetical protein EDD40_2605 [Saccharothrix texasensis]
MLTIERAGVAVNLALIVVFAGSVPAFADIYGNVDCFQSPTPDCQLDAGSSGQDGDQADDAHKPGHSGSEDDSTAGESACRHVPVDYQPSTGQPQEPGGWFIVLCSPDGKDPDSHGPVWVPANADSPPTMTPAQVALIARKRLRLPAPSIAASPFGNQLVHLPTWLWLSDGWVPSTATASVPGVSVTAVAEPTSATWSMGDGSSVTCVAPGTPFLAGSDPKAPSPDCGHTYRTSSAGQVGQAFPVSVTVHWTVTWAGAGQSGTFPNLTTTGNAAFRVAESQALNNNGRG